MFIAPHEWSLPLPGPGNPGLTAARAGEDSLPALYQRLLSRLPNETDRTAAAAFLEQQIAALDAQSCDLPESPAGLESWMQSSAQQATSRYSAYLEERKAGAPRRYFSNRAHALYFLRAVAPTKLVDGAWLYGLVAHWQNPRFADLIRTYVEELGEGEPDKNHVVLYRQLLARHGLDTGDVLDDSLYTQGLIQLALACNAEDFLPEVIGFNLGYEQLPLHLLITSYELNELGIDPYYFTLHVTVDNPDTGHARRAVQALHDTLPRLGNHDDFWRRVRTGFLLGNAGVGTNEVIEGFDITREVTRIFSQKSGAGHGAHSDYCRIGGRHVNDWLACPEDMPVFLRALQTAGWIKRGESVEQSRFWHLLQGQRAEMFGVFTTYELQVIHDWIRGAASADGLAYTQSSMEGSQPRQPSFRVAARLAATQGRLALSATAMPDLLDSDLQALKQQLPLLPADGQMALLVEAMAPSHHWTPAGMFATRLFCDRAI